MTTARATEHGASESTGAQPFEIVVLFTTLRQTLAALQTAGRLAHGLAARLRLLVPQVVPYPLPLDRPPVASLDLVRDLRPLLDELGLESRIEIRCCRDRWHTIREALPHPSVLVMAGGRRWWPDRQFRLAARLRAAGHQVVLSAPE